MNWISRFFTKDKRFDKWYSYSNESSYNLELIDKKKPIDAFLGNDSIYSIIHKIALNGSTLKYKVFKGEKEVYDDYFDFMEKPNEEESRFEFIYKAIVNFSLNGDLYILKEQTSIGFGIDKMTIFPSQSVVCNRENESDIFSPIVNYEVTIGSIIKKYAPDDIIHLKYYDPSIQALESNNGLSPLQAGQYILEANNNLTVAEASILNNRGANNLISGTDAQYGLNQNEQASIDNSLKNRIGGAKRFNKSIVTSSPVKVHKLDMSPQDLRLIESFPNQLRRLCTLFSMPAELFNAEGSGQFNTRKEALKSSYTEGIIPIVELIYSAIDRGLKRGYTQEVDRSKIDALNPSREEKNNSYLEMFKSGAISRETFLELTDIQDNGKTFRTITNNRQEVNS